MHQKQDAYEAEKKKTKKKNNNNKESKNTLRKVAQWIEIVRFVSYCVEATKCLPNSYHNKNPDQTVIYEVARLKETHCDASAKILNLNM